MNSIKIIKLNGCCIYKTPDPHRLLINFQTKIDLNRFDKSVALSNLSIY